MSTISVDDQIGSDKRHWTWHARVVLFVLSLHPGTSHFWLEFFRARTGGCAHVISGKQVPNSGFVRGLSNRNVLSVVPAFVAKSATRVWLSRGIICNYRSCRIKKMVDKQRFKIFRTIGKRGSVPRWRPTPSKCSRWQAKKNACQLPRFLVKYIRNVRDKAGVYFRIEFVKAAPGTICDELHGGTRAYNSNSVPKDIDNRNVFEIQPLYKRWIPNTYKISIRFRWDLSINVAKYCI